MSAEAVATLQRIWGKLTFARVTRVIAREPEDVLSITVHRYDGHTDYLVRSRRTADIPEKDRQRTRVAWRHYFGFTDGGIYFQKGDYHGLDCSIDLTMDFSRWGNHNGGFDKPEVGSLIGGEVIDTPKGKRFKRWFRCLPEFKLLVDIVLNGTTLTEDELGRKLVTASYPDTYWAIARLVLFDNVQAFVDQLKPVDRENDTRPLHPAHGMFSGSVMYSGKHLTINHRGMWLPEGAAKYVHEISYRLNESSWWEEFKRLAAEQSLEHNHPLPGGLCNACEIEQRKHGKLRYPDHYDY
ncbi:hypothetical protein ACFL11_00470 [Patescibacteria group bacterium]